MNKLLELDHECNKRAFNLTIFVLEEEEEDDTLVVVKE